MSQIRSIKNWGDNGVPWMGGAILSFVFMAVSARELSIELNALQILVWRSLTAALIMSLVLCFAGWGQIRTKRLGMQVSRGAIHFVAQYGWFFGITMIPLADVFALEFTAPIWTVIFAVLFLGERVSFGRLAGVAIGFFGILIVLRPGVEVIEPAAVIVLISAALYAVAYVMVKTLTKTDSPLCIMFYMSLVQLALAAVVSAADWTAPSNITLWAWVLAVGISSLTAHYCLAQALMRSDASTIMPIDFCRLPIIMLVAFCFYGELIDIWVLVGALVIVIGNSLNISQNSDDLSKNR